MLRRLKRLPGDLSDGRADIWSTGVMHLRDAGRRVAIQGKDISALYRLINEPFIPLPEFGRDLPDGLSAILEKAVVKKLDDRCATAEQMAFDLHSIPRPLKMIG
jgi:serine/threonine-protein kinase